MLSEVVGVIVYIVYLLAPGLLVGNYFGWRRNKFFLAYGSGLSVLVFLLGQKVVNILGIHSALNQFNHDPGAALICGDRLIAVCEEERFNRIKWSTEFPNGCGCCCGVTNTSYHCLLS